MTWKHAREAALIASLLAVLLLLYAHIDYYLRQPPG
jgi:hypothetical protein